MYWRLDPPSSFSGCRTYRDTLSVMNPGRRDALIGALATFVLFTLFAGQFWRNLLGWWGFGIVAALALIGSIIALVALKPEWHWRRVPKSLLAFLALALLSTAWSAHPTETLLGTLALAATAVAGAFLGLCLTWRELVRALGDAFRWILGLSLVFELWVAIFLRQPLLPNFVEYGDENIPMAFYWSRALLFHGGPIEGIVASRNLLGMIALLAVIVFAVQLATQKVRRLSGTGWLVFAGIMLVLTRSATIILVAVLVAAAVLFVLWARRADPGRRLPIYATAAAVLVAAVIALISAWNWLLELFGKSEDVTGRFDIWKAVSELASERPWFGWGWVGYWPPWVEPFDDLAVRKGVTYLQAHNAWLDVWMQLGIVGLFVFGALVLSTLWRSWFIAIDRPVTTTGRPLPFSVGSMLPLLLIVALIGQSLAESRLLVEGAFALLAALAFMTKRRQLHPEALP